MKFALSVPDWVTRWRNYFPIVDVLGRYKRRDLSHDLFAGWVVSVITVPQAIAYAFLAGLPPQAGLYASVVPPLLYAVLGSSPSLAVGPVAVIAIMVAEAVRAHAPAFSDAYLGVTAVICLQSAITLWLLRLTQMGGIVNLLSHPVISGFINAAAIMIILSQLTALTGIPSVDGSPFAQARHLVTDLSAVNPVALAIGCASFVLLWLVQRFGYFLVLPFLRRVGRNHPITRVGPMLVALLAIAAVLVFGLDHRYGIATVGPIAGGLPTLAWPPFDVALWLDVMPASAMIALVAYVQSFSIGTQLAQRKRQRLNPNQELIALGAADFGAAFTGGMPVAGSLSRSTGGGRTPLDRRVLRAVRARHGVVADAVLRGITARGARRDHHHVGVGLHRLLAGVPLLEVLSTRQHHPHRVAVGGAAVRRRTRTADRHSGRGRAVRAAVEPPAHRNRRPGRRFGALPQRVAVPGGDPPARDGGTDRREPVLRQRESGRRRGCCDSSRAIRRSVICCWCAPRSTSSTRAASKCSSGSIASWCVAT